VADFSNLPQEGKMRKICFLILGFAVAAYSAFGGGAAENPALLSQSTGHSVSDSIDGGGKYLERGQRLFRGA
jgi:hypothetical protein